MNNDIERFILTAADKHSKLWVRLMKHTEKRLGEVRLLLETCEDEKQSAAYRGQIRELKNYLNLDKTVVKE